ncbi:hypothetical protein EWU45_10715 [Enterococcus faecium]|nr:hypothetical protein EWU45_10715 [Enterococcus faecium]
MNTRLVERLSLKHCLFANKGTVTKVVSQLPFFSNKRCSKACICGNKPNQTKNMRSYFCLAVLIT